MGGMGKVALKLSIGKSTAPVQPESALDSLKGKRISVSTHSHGGGYAKKEREYWFPQWAGTTCYRYDMQFNRLGTFSVHYNHVMGITQDWDGYFYTARWQYGTICKFGPYPSNGHRWCHHIGRHSSGVAVNDDLGEVYGNTHEDRGQIFVMDMASGSRRRVLSMENYQNSYAGYGSLHGWGDSTQTTLIRSSGTQPSQQFIDMYQYKPGSSQMKLIWRKKLREKFSNDASIFDGRIIYQFRNNNQGRMYEVYNVDVYYPDQGEMLVCDGKTFRKLIGDSTAISRKYLE